MLSESGNIEEDSCIYMSGQARLLRGKGTIIKLVKREAHLFVGGCSSFLPLELSSAGGINGSRTPETMHDAARYRWALLSGFGACAENRRSEFRSMTVGWFMVGGGGGEDDSLLRNYPLPASRSNH